MSEVAPDSGCRTRAGDPRSPAVAAAEPRHRSCSASRSSSCSSLRSSSGASPGGAERAGGLPSWLALAGGGVIIVGLIATIGLLRIRWAYVLGWVLQVLILASGFLNPAMFVVGVLFGGMWWYCMVVGSRIDRQRAAAAAPGKEQQ